MEIEKAMPPQAEWINGRIRIEFPYTTFTPKKIEERMCDLRYCVLIAKQKNILTGFAELEFFPEKKEARLNAVFVDEPWRDHKIGTALVGQCINECKHKKVQRLFLLVKATNIGAKYFYEDRGFSFAGMHDKIIDNDEVEVWDMEV